MQRSDIMSSAAIREVAQAAGLDTAKKLSEASGVSFGTCWKILAGRGDVRESTLARLTEYFRTKGAAA